MRTRSLVFVDSINAFDRPQTKAASIPCRCLRILRPSSTKAGMRQRVAQRIQSSRPRGGATPFRRIEPQLLFQQVGPVETGVRSSRSRRAGPPGDGQVLGVLPEGVAGPSARWRSRGMPARRASFQTSRRTSSSASVAHATTWKGSMQSVAFFAALATTSAIHSAASAETWVTAVQRSVPSRSKNPAASPRRRPLPRRAVQNRGRPLR